MYLYKTRKHDRHMRHWRGLFEHNTVLVLGLALPFVICASFSLQAAVSVILGMIACTLPSMALSHPLRRVLPLWLRLPIYTLLAAGILIPLDSLLTRLMPVTQNALGIYFPILAVNTILIYRSEHPQSHRSFLALLKDGVLHIAGFSLVMLMVALVRELFGNGSIWGIPVPFITFKLSGLSIPFAGCILTAFLAAGAKRFGRAIRVYFYKSDVGRSQRSLND